MSVKMRYAEAIDYKEYERKIRKLLDDHIDATGTRAITELVDIFDVEAFDREVKNIQGAAAKADTIAHRLKRTVIEKMEQDPAFYRKFSELVEATIQTFREGRITELEYLEAMADALEQVREGQDQAAPAQLRHYRHASAYYGIIQEILAGDSHENADQALNDSLADLAIQIEAIIEGRKIRDWANNPDIQNTIWNDIEDYLYDAQEDLGLEMATSDMDLIIENVIDVARKQDTL